MRATARRSTAEYPDYYTYEDDADQTRWELTPGDRVCPPSYGSSRKARLFKAFVFLLLVGSGWTFRDRVDWQQLPAQAAAFLGNFHELLSAEPDGVAEAASETASAQTGSQSELANLGPELASTSRDQLAAEHSPMRDEAQPTAAPRNESIEEQAVPVTINSVPSPGEPAEDSDAGDGKREQQVEPLPPADPDPADPYQVRAAAVGLHPGLSRVLLERLTATDYRNAGIAIKHALAKTPNGAEYVWPRQRKPELALFKVHFVKGAAPGCRRYVVTIVKDGWSTTALPMENCDVEGPASGQRKVSSLPRR